MEEFPDLIPNYSCRRFLTRAAGCSVSRVSCKSLNMKSLRLGNWHHLFPALITRVSCAVMLAPCCGWQKGGGFFDQGVSWEQDTEDVTSKSDLFRTECVLAYTGRTGPKYCTANDLYETDFLQKAFSLLGTKGFSFRS